MQWNSLVLIGVMGAVVLAIPMVKLVQRLARPSLSNARPSSAVVPESESESEPVESNESSHETPVDPALERLKIRVEATRSVGSPTLASFPNPTVSKPRRVMARTLRLARRFATDNGDPLRATPAVRALGLVRATGFQTPLTSQQQALVALLGIRGPLGREQISDCLWSGKPISASRFANLLTEIRRVIGRERLVQRPDGRYELVGVDSDIDCFRELIAGVDGVMCEVDDVDPAVRDALLDRLERAITLIEGPVLEGGHRRYWGWIDDEYHTRSSLEQMIVTAGLAAAGLALEAHQPQRARWATERCLSAVPHDERLVAELAAMHLAQGRQASAAELVAGWEHTVRRLGVGEPSTGPRNLLVAGLRVRR